MSQLPDTLAPRLTLEGRNDHAGAREGSDDRHGRQRGARGHGAGADPDDRAAKALLPRGEEITATAAGFTPGGLVNFAVDGTSLGPLVADRPATSAAPIRLGGMKGAKSHGMTATDQTNPALVGSAAFLGTTRQVVVKPTNARAGTKRRIKGYGFMSGPRVYMHVRGNGYSADKRIAKPASPCGTFATRGSSCPPRPAPGATASSLTTRRSTRRRPGPGDGLDDGLAALVGLHGSWQAS